MSKVRANNFTNKAGTGAPTFPYGANVTGVITATSFSGDGGGPSVSSQEFAGNGGNGLPSSITGIAVTYAGGGGGGVAGDSPPGLSTGQPGPGGGGIGGVGQPAFPVGYLRNATAGTDGLGGGGGAQYSPLYGLSGGSGIVIIAYPTS